MSPSMFEKTSAQDTYTVRNADCVFELSSANCSTGERTLVDKNFLTEHSFMFYWHVSQLQGQDNVPQCSIVTEDHQGNELVGAYVAPDLHLAIYIGQPQHTVELLEFPTWRPEVSYEH